uniref:Uncharacterized protein n=1 Tax=Timema shepardi TaxID=629360 RepID=A0A7R9B360_TIMSH|nr:unnamed protein product [Timema shepardi]
MDPSDATGDKLCQHPLIPLPILSVHDPQMERSTTSRYEGVVSETSLKEAEQLHKKLEVRVKRSKQPTKVENVTPFLSSESSSKKRFSNVDSGGGDLVISSESPYNAHVQLRIEE